MDGFPPLRSPPERRTSASPTQAASPQPNTTQDTSSDTKSAGAIFLHAGAGYHSQQNEMMHLSLLHRACHAAMARIKAEEPATKAVEAAIKVMEDADFTNAGTGSNLNEDGIVEGDANIVDHMGRSGACGAVPGVKNPICLARAVLENSNNPDFSWRMPPNLLVGVGARNFASRRGIEVCEDEELISQNSRLRWTDWRRDLDRLNAAAGIEEKINSTFHINTEAARDHINAVRTGTWNEGQPDSPTKGDSEESLACPMASPKRVVSAPVPATMTTIDRAQPVSVHVPRPQKRSNNRGRLGEDNDSQTKKARVKSPSPELEDTGSKQNYQDFQSAIQDDIQDTVGAIAIDIHGNIAAGSSSGGVGMKLEGRVGPAALVGVGTAVVPMCLADDDEEAAIATVCSGTGEHFATTQAAQRCAESVRHCVGDPDIKDRGDEVTEEMAIDYFVRDLFLGHPSVKDSKIQPGIGVLAVKQAKGGYYMHFAHNTTSFAVASFSTEDKEPKGVISRRREPKFKPRKKISVTMGARKLPATPKKSWQPDGDKWETAAKKGWSRFFRLGEQQSAASTNSALARPSTSRNSTSPSSAGSKVSPKTGTPAISPDREPSRMDTHDKSTQHGARDE